MAIRIICILVFFYYSDGIRFCSGQQNLLNKKVTIEFKEKSLSEAISILNKKMGNIFSYKTSIFSANKTITLKTVNESLKSLLEKMFKESGIYFFQSGDQIILKKSRSDKAEGIQKKIGSTESVSIVNNSFERQQLNYLLFSFRKVEIDIADKLDKSEVDYSFIETQALPPLEPISIEPDFSEVSTTKSRGNHSLVFSPGIKNNSKTSVIAEDVSFSANSGITAVFSYGYMLSESWQLNFNTGMFVAEADVSETVLSAKAIIPLLIGFRYYPPFLKISDFGNFYGGGALGAYIGFGSVLSENAETISQAETKAGVSLSFGLDMYPFRWLKIGPNASFHLFDDYTKIFEEPKNYSGAEFSINMGIVF